MVSGNALIYLQAVVGAVAEAQAAVRDLSPAQSPQQGHMVLDVPGSPARRLTYSIGCSQTAVLIHPRYVWLLQSE